MEQPEGFVLSKNEQKVCKLVKPLYRLKQGPKNDMKNLIEQFYHLTLSIMLL